MSPVELYIKTFSPAFIPEGSSELKRSLNVSTLNVEKEKRRKIKVFFINLTLDEPLNMLVKVLKVNLKELREMKKGEKRNKIKKHLTNKLRRAKKAVKEIK